MNRGEVLNTSGPVARPRDHGGGIHPTSEATTPERRVFLPTYLFVVIPAPYYRRIAHNVQIQAFVAGVTAAATGAIGGAAVVLGRRAIVDVPTVLIAAATLLVLVKVKKAPEPLLILAAGVVGVVLRRGGAA